MPFFIPAAAVGFGVTLFAWGAKMFFSNDDSADQVAKEFVRNLPAKIKAKVDSVEITPSGVKVNFKNNVPINEQEEAMLEIKKNVKVVKKEAARTKKATSTVKSEKSAASKKTATEPKKESAKKKATVGPAKSTKVTKKPLEKISAKSNVEKK